MLCHAMLEGWQEIQSCENGTANAPFASNRSFLTRAYPTMKHHNPHTPIMVREALNTQPRVFARYEFGREKVEELGGEFQFHFLYGYRKDGVDIGEHGGRLLLL
jgi:hypothetical protein